ncbi:hypothetical protein SLEP1_g10511 [Rubroshorea leprosula]|uniref:Ninja-family protein n=1 Tax=Rubroshorea leprosula TaxID=152421 RepID=A0AAV5I8B0_9ROSI|nr:hypothetical protein SLEP1_g10511 [Rubroshorea leprosula]
MAKDEEVGNRFPHEDTSMPNFHTDLLQRFMSSNHLSHKRQLKNEEDEEEIELSLGLSLNGRFGVDPRAKKLTRSSSIPDFLTNPLRKDCNENSCGFPVAWAPLVRTSSLPTETEEEWRKRKELQTLRRMEAKRKRSEKQRNLKAARNRSKGSGEENCEEDKREEIVNGNSNEFLPFGVPSWLNGGRGVGRIEVKGEKTTDLPQAVAAPQGSNGSLGSGSSGMSEFEGQSVQGTNKCLDARSPSSVQSTIETEQRERVIQGRLQTQGSGNFAGVAIETPPGNPAVADKGVKEVVRNILEDMPCVSTTGNGPNGKRIEGFLYRYRKGEEVRIVCVCHGSFLSPAEFVKHAGGGDVAHPLKHIVVNPSPLL